MDLLLLVLVATLAGGATAISPCVLPVLPMVLGASVDGGRLRPVGVVVGLVGSFVIFTLALTRGLQAVGVSPGVLRNVAITVLVVFGASLLIPGADALTARLFAPLGRLGARLGERNAGREGLRGGLLLGAALGLAWTPCAGPIFTAVTASVAAGDLGATSAVVLTAYAVGAAVPLLAVGLAGRRVVGRLGPASARVRPVVGALMMVTGGLMFAGLDVRLAASTGGGDYVQALQGIERADAIAGPLGEVRGYEARPDTPRPTSGGSLPRLGAAPPLQGISAWFNTVEGAPITLESLRGRVVLIDFWTYSCVNCLRTIPHLQALDRAYRDKGLTIVGVHTPEFAFEADPDNVRSAIADLGVTWPVALDPDFATFRAYRNQYWPAEYLIDRDGEVRDVKIGEGGYADAEARIRELLGLDGDGRGGSGVADETPRDRGLTPESYLGGHRIDRFASPQPLVANTPTRFSLPARLDLHELAYSGELSVAGESVTAVEDAAIELRFRARKVFLVLDSPGRGRTGRVLLDGAPVGGVGRPRRRSRRLPPDRSEPPLRARLHRRPGHAASPPRGDPAGRSGLRVHIRLATGTRDQPAHLAPVGSLSSAAMRHRLSLPVALLAAATLAAGCGDEDAAPSAAQTSTGSSSECSSSVPEPAQVSRSFDAPPAMVISPGQPVSATIETTCGTMAVELDTTGAPKTANNFVFLARKRYFDGLRFHRVVSDFVIQGGDPNGDGSGGPGYSFADELPTTPYDLGDLVMANSGPDTNGSQFFVVTGVNGTSLPLNYARFGRVTSGLDVAQRIEALADPSGNEKPTQPVAIVKVTIAG